MPRKAIKRINLEEVAALTERLFHAHYDGNPQAWFDYLCPDSVYVGTGEPLLVGGDAICDHFKDLQGYKVEVVQEEYHPVSLDNCAAQVYGQIAVKGERLPYGVVNRFTMTFKQNRENLQLVHLHNSYEYLDPLNPEEDERTLQLDVNTMQFVRSLLLDKNLPSCERIPVRSGRQTIYLDPRTLIYVQSRRKRTDLICIDRVISCNSPINELAGILPDNFYPIHRGYLVNKQYIVSLCRYEAKLISGISIPVPALTYMQVKQDLAELLQKK